jgi:hypothetical protein
MNFKPQKVPFDFKNWTKESLELMIRKYQLFILFAFFVSLISYLSTVFSLLNFIFPLILGAGTLIAYCSDKSEPVINFLKKKPTMVWIRLLIVGGAFFLLNFVFGLFLPDDEIITSEIVKPFTVRDISIRIMANIAIFVSLFGFIFITFVPLVAVAELTIKRAFIQAIDAMWLNAGVIFTFAFATAFLNIVVGVASIYAILPWLCFISTMQYVLYRHIWLNKPKNELKKESVKISLTSTSAERV